ncbi:hypothetical protein HNR46_002964 [Haloferula luteola]|uniref:Ice-binding protein C-terminal domain-containing protein n=1 Tax=Haloferula luteola TaxID=595692 RepID=A0A840V6Q8_9BACT|nr:PEP-CTERM sorting domain-containing protein [Haloferula luteola]MBB5352716.1 hypothetical protein [Haloferula luteola]
MIPIILAPRRPKPLAVISTFACISFISLLAGPRAEAVTTLTAPGTTGDPFLDPAVTGSSVSSSVWNELSQSTLSGYGTYPGATAWPAPISPQSGDATPEFDKVSGNAYPASSSIYLGGFSSTPNADGASFAISESSPVSGLQTLVFQIQIGEAFGYDFKDGIEPVLSYTTASGTVTGLAADFSVVYDAFQNGEMSGEPVYVNTYALQWDLSGVSEAISGFSITFDGVQHATLYGMRLDQGSDAANSLLPVTVPEPAAALLSGLGMLAWLRRRRI